MNVSLEQLQTMLERLLSEKSSLMIDNAVLRERVRELEAYVLKAQNWFDHFGADSPIYFGGEDVMSAEARGLLARNGTDDE